jgi:lysophospholipase L1-like esterase
MNLCRNLRRLAILLALTGPGATAADLPALTLAREGNWLEIRGDHLPGGRIRVNYLEAYCRAGSTDADWHDTVIPHDSQVTRTSPDGRTIEIRDTLADGLVVDHVVTAREDVVEFRLTARNPTSRRSEAHWAQACPRLAAFTGHAEDGPDLDDYLPKCFVFLDGRLERLPTRDWATKARYVPGQVWCPPQVPRTDVNPRPLSPLVPSNGLIGCFSGDDSLVFATAWQPWQELFQGVARCLHADFRLCGVEPGETRTIRGAIYVVRADIPALLTRYHRDFPEHAVPVARPAVECTPRHGLPHFFAKAKVGGEVRVAYLGGSITAAPGWRVGSLEWLKRRFPAASFRELNAAIGGTGSDLGAFRVGQDVVAGKPDLVFVEFAVNDGGTAPEQIQATMEGIVRQLKRADPATDICFVYTLSSPVLADLEAGRCQRSAAAMETVADHYRIPSVHFGPEVAKRIAAGTLVFKGEKPEPFDAASLPMLFSTDGVHPLVETGHVLYTDVLTRSLEAIERAGEGGEPPAMPEPLRADHWEAARLLPITREMLRGGWQRCEPEADPLGRQFAARMPALWKTAAPGASLAFRVTVPEAAGVKTRRLAAYDLLGPGGGTVEIRVDGGEPRKLPRIDGYCTYWRLATLPLGDLTAGEHTIEVTLTADHPDKRTILFEHNRADLDKHPEKYAADAWYVGGLLVFGAALPTGQ